MTQDSQALNPEHPQSDSTPTDNLVQDNDVRQRFFIQESPVRGDVVRLSRSYASTIAQKP